MQEEVFRDLQLLMIHNATLELAHVRRQRLVAWRILAEVMFRSLGGSADLEVRVCYFRAHR